MALDDSEQSVREAHTEPHNKLNSRVIEERSDDDVERVGMALHQLVKLSGSRIVDGFESRT